MGTINESYRNAAANAGLPNTQYLALFVGEPGNGGVEVTGVGYARAAVTMGAAAAGARANTSGPHSFAAGAGGWQAGVNWSALMSELSGGTWVSKDPLTGTRDLSAQGATVAFAVGALVQSIT